MNTIQVTARAKIHEGKLEEFLQLATQCMQIVREQDKGTLQYDWFLNADQTECVVRETYRDSDAVLEHVAHLGATMGAILGTGDWTIEVYGNPSAALVEATAGLGPKVYSALQSL